MKQTYLNERPGHPIKKRFSESGSVVAARGVDNALGAVQVLLKAAAEQSHVFLAVLLKLVLLVIIFVVRSLSLDQSFPDVSFPSPRGCDLGGGLFSFEDVLASLDVLGLVEVSILAALVLVSVLVNVIIVKAVVSFLLNSKCIL